MAYHRVQSWVLFSFVCVRKQDDGAPHSTNEAIPCPSRLDNLVVYRAGHSLWQQLFNQISKESKDRNHILEAQISNLNNSFWSYAAGGEERFEVDRRSGEIRTTAQPLTPSKEYLLQVQAMDQQGRKGPRATVAVLAGYRPPQFINATYNLDVPEDTSVGQPWVSRLYYQGSDTLPSHEIRLTPSPGSGCCIQFEENACNNGKNILEIILNF